MDHVFWEIGQFGNVNSETFVHHARLHLVQQCELIIFGQSNHVTVFDCRNCIGQICDFVEMRREQCETFRLFCQMSEKR